MAKTTPTVLQSYKRANKERKAKMLLKYGYKTEAGFLKAFSEETPSTKKATAKKVTPKKAAKKVVPTKVVATTATKTSSTKVEDITTKTTDYVIAFDTTGSMGSYIAAVRKHVQEVVVNLFKNVPNLKVKIVAFGDYCDMESSKVFGKAYQTIELTDNQNDLVKFIQHAKNTSGGDGDEFYELVIKKINEETDWRDGIKSVLFIGDDNPHKVGYSLAGKVQNAQIDWKEEAKTAAKMGIQYDTLRIHSTPWYKQLSEMTGGVCIDFTNASKVSNIVEASTYVRSSKSAFAAKSAAAFASGDEELIGAYKSMETLL